MAEPRKHDPLKFEDGSFQALIAIFVAGMCRAAWVTDFDGDYDVWVKFLGPLIFVAVGHGMIAARVKNAAPVSGTSPVSWYYVVLLFTVFVISSSSPGDDIP